MSFLRAASSNGTKCGVPNFAPFLLGALTDTDRVRGATRINLFGDNAKFFEKDVARTPLR